MATIARFVAEMGVDPAGVKAGLDRAAAYVRQFAKTADQEITGSLEKSNNAVSSLTTRIFQLAAALGVAFAIKAGIDFNRTIESAELGIASLITAQARLKDANGNTLTGTKALGAAQAIAAEQMHALRIAGIQTAATTEELVQGFQQAVGVGLRWGLTLDQIRKITIGIVQAAGALGVPMNQLNEEIRDLLAGNINARNTRVATALGITNEDIRNARQTGQLADFVLGKLAAFNVAGEATAKTWAGVTSNIREAFQVFMGDAIKPAFDSVKIALNTALADVFDLDNARISENFAGILDVAQRIFGGVGDLLAKAIGKGVELAKDFNTWLVRNRSEIDGILTSFGLLVAAAGSLVGDVLKLLTALGAVGTESGFFRTILVGAGLAAAEIHTAFQGLIMILVPLGHLILSALIKPLEWVNRLISGLISIINPNSVAGSLVEGILGKGALEKGRQFFADLGTAGDDFLGKITDGWQDYVDDIALGGTATDKFLAKLAEVDKMTTKIANKPAPTATATITPGGGTTGPSLADQIKDLEQLTGRLVTLRNISEKAGTVTSAFSNRVADAMVTAETLLARETDKLSDNAVRLTIVIDKLREAYLKVGALPSVNFTPVAKPRAIDARGNSTEFAARTSLLRGGPGSTVGLVGPRGGPGFTLPQPKAAPIPPATQSPFEIRFNAVMSRVTDGAEHMARGLGSIVATGGLQVLKSILSQLNPFSIIVSALSDAMKPLEPVLKVLGQIIAEVLAPIFKELAPIVAAFIPFFRALLQIISPLVRALLPILEAFVPILEALFPVIKFAAIALTYFIQAAALAASIILRFAGNIIIVIGEIFKALAKAIDALPGVSAKHAIDVAQGVIDFGRGMLGAADAFKKTADSMDDARREINGVDIDHTVDGINDLGDAASAVAASLMNVPTWYKIALNRFHAAMPVIPDDGRTPGGEHRRRFPLVSGTGGAASDTGGMTSAGGGGITIQGDVLVDARTMSAGELFDAILNEGNKRARAQGVGKWSEVR